MSMSKNFVGSDPVMIAGKRFAGTLVNARPFVEMWPRCIFGFLAGRDFKGRGFDNGDVRTSTVQKLHIEEGMLYAITLNSAYRLAGINLMAFLYCPEWREDIEALVYPDGILIEKEVSSEEFRKISLSSYPEDSEVKSSLDSRRTLRVGNTIYIEILEVK